jgi:hypothetical protein
MRACKLTKKGLLPISPANTARQQKSEEVILATLLGEPNTNVEISWVQTQQNTAFFARESKKGQLESLDLGTIKL